MAKDQTLIALFETPHEASLVLRSLLEVGYPREDISLIIPDERGTRTDRTGQNLSEIDDERLTTKRVATGASAGGVLGAIAGLTALAIPGVGPFLAAGPVIAILGGASAGAVAGALGGTLVDIGVPREKLDFYKERLGRGHALVAARSTTAGLARAEAIFREHDAIDIGALEEPHPTNAMDLNATAESQNEQRNRNASPPFPPIG